MLETLRDNHREFLATLFAVSVVAIAWLEVFFPRRPAGPSRLRRWISNLSIGTFNTVIFALTVTLGGVVGAIIAEEHGWGMLRLISAPDWLAILLGILAIDVFGYAIHRVLHVVPALWRLHHVHHSDIDIDFTTTVRHHPLEMVFGETVIFAATVALGVPLESILLRQIVATVLEFANHSNVQFPKKLDEWIRWVFVTPDMHVVHHSAVKRETDSNYGSILSLWDRLFGTYVAAPARGIAGMTIGLDYRREPQDQRLDQVLIAPFVEPRRVHAAGRPAALATD